MHPRFSTLAIVLATLAAVAACSDDTNGSAGQDTAGSGLPIFDGVGDAAGSDAATGSDATGADTAEADTAEADAIGGDGTAEDAAATDTAPSDSVATDTAVDDTTVSDTATTDTTVSDSTVSDSTVSDTATTDTATTDTTVSDTTVSDTAVSDTATTDTATTDTATTDTAPDALGPFPGKVGACKQGAPGYDSCWVQAFVQCLQPGPTCAGDLTFPPDGSTVFDTSWSNGSSLHCVTTTAGSDLTIICTGKGPDGKQCLEATYTSAGEMPGPATVTGPNGVQKSAYDSSFKRVITCSDGKVETYDKAEDLCYPLQSGVCEVNTGGGG